MTTKGRYDAVIAWFSEHMPVAGSELQYTDPYQLLVAVILSAQCTDKRVNMTTPALFERLPKPFEMAKDTTESMEYPSCIVLEKERIFFTVCSGALVVAVAVVAMSFVCVRVVMVMVVRMSVGRRVGVTAVHGALRSAEQTAGPRRLEEIQDLGTVR